MSDSPDVAELCLELGYPVTVEQVERRLAEITSDSDHVALVAESEDGRVVGWVHVHGSKLLLSSPRAEIGGLVVAAECRRRGVGRALMVAAEGWARDKGYGGIRVRSNVIRSDAHDFYRGLDYSSTKRSHVFEKVLG